jgi:hypothetical protein
MYSPEAALLLLSYATPVVAWLISHNGGMVSRSGSIFLAAVAEFVMLNRRRVMLELGRHERTYIVMVHNPP